MAKYQVGDVVVVREDLEIKSGYRMEGNLSESNSVVYEMLIFAGQEVTIASIEYGQYLVEKRGNRFHWTDEMFAGLASEVNEPDYELSDMSLEELIGGVPSG